ncbi:hypothetical protein E2C01_072915 [Portunus trituberculatus]|uniref:Uncharacterized protein n=1 Tax=Portunus trituberculatus TaxID=210409 RepID=A0A5B7I963_PORTR|nr:hypothetical protein [Portunus trituberculatus]
MIPPANQTSFRQGRARQGKAGQGKARQGKARQGRAGQGRAGQGKARQGKPRRVEGQDHFLGLCKLASRLEEVKGRCGIKTQT